MMATMKSLIVLVLVACWTEPNSLKKIANFNVTDVIHNGLN